ncbi:MAG TPA: phytase [Steroidobacteraceae bacterium]
MPTQKMLSVLVLVIAGCAQRAGQPGGPHSPVAVPPHPVAPVAETVPVESAGDAADDPAIWVHPEDPRLSLVIGTDKRRGLNVYDLDGQLLQTLPDGRMNNVDVRDGLTVNGRSMALVAATNRTDRTIALYLLDPVTRRLARAGDPVPTGFAEPYGLCLYASRDGGLFVFASDSGSGQFRQWRIRADGGVVGAERVRTFRVGSQAEGCVADDETGALYVAEEDVALWKYQADPGAGNARRAIDRVGGASGLAADLEGVSIWLGGDGGGYLVLSNQGANRYAVYRRDGANAYVGSFELVEHAAARIDGVSETDGLAITSRPLGARYPHGLLVVQDGSNLPAGQNQNFKLVSWRDVAAALGIPDQD